jgi:hypothetical protein
LCQHGDPRLRWPHLAAAVEERRGATPDLLKRQGHRYLATPALVAWSTG